MTANGSTARPRRIRMCRQRPWREQNPDAVNVARPTKWGNPYRVGDITPVWRDKLGWPARHTRASAVEAFADLVERRGSAFTREARAELAGHDLACWCPLDEPCHADVLLRLANGGP